MKNKIFAFSIFCALCSVLCHGAYAANVVQRDTVSRATPSRINTASRMPAVKTTVVTAPEVVEEIATEIPEPVVIENKSGQFDAVLSGSNITGIDTASDARSEMIRSQRAALDAAAVTETTTAKTQAAVAKNSNTCDNALRTCMRAACGNDFSKCAGDGDTDWGNKMEKCRAQTTCTGTEYTVFAREIKADRDMNARLAEYVKLAGGIDEFGEFISGCGQRYNNCIATQCGKNYSACLSKSASDAAINLCAPIANECRTIDSGMASRWQSVFGSLRSNAEVQIKKDEETLYALRQKMSEQCTRLGAMFDARTLDCVFTVNFFADNSDIKTDKDISGIPYASKKAYAGNTFDCTQDWFGIDITTYRENADRLTREQSAASNAMLGAGVGIAAGALSSGAIGRAMDTNKANRALKSAEKEHATGQFSPAQDNGTSPQSLQEQKTGVPLNHYNQETYNSVTQNNTGRATTGSLTIDAQKGTSTVNLQEKSVINTNAVSAGGTDKLKENNAAAGGNPFGNLASSGAARNAAAPSGNATGTK